MGDVQSVELLLDPATDAAVRSEWAVLSEAGLPSLADHRSQTNAPHVTLVAVPERLDQAAENAVAELAARVPLRLRLGPFLVFNGRRPVLARLVLTDPALTALHAAVVDAVGGPPALAPFSAPGEWVPHVTLSRNIGVDQVSLALATLTGRDDRAAIATRLRRWDSERRQAWLL